MIKAQFRPAMRDEAQPQTTFPLLFQPLSPLRQHAAKRHRID
jgi:hypothetical protein